MGGSGTTLGNPFLETMRSLIISKKGLDNAPAVENKPAKETNTDEKAQNQIEENKKEELRKQMLGSQQTLGDSKSYSIRKYYLG